MSIVTSDKELGRTLREKWPNVTAEDIFILHQTLLDVGTWVLNCEFTSGKLYQDDLAWIIKVANKATAQFNERR